MPTCIGPMDDCPAVVGRDQDTGAEEFCGAVILFADHQVHCTAGHQFTSCPCGRPVCSGWRLPEEARR